MKVQTLLASLVAAAVLPLNAQISALRMTVEQAAKSEKKSKTAPEYTQERTLKIRLDNNSAQAIDDVTVQYWFLGRDMKEREIRLVKQGERKVSLKPRGKELVESETASSSYVEEHSGINTFAALAGAKGIVRTKVPASGTKFTGYVARAMKDGKVLAEYYSEPSLKASVDKAK